MVGTKRLDTHGKRTDLTVRFTPLQITSHKVVHLLYVGKYNGIMNTSTYVNMLIN